ncbi:MAG: hypothetical protein GEU98_06180 [Pseudonocardiaceae bacterium]|nr:hypothetical protein [Pseudonocardiaceae bacterium]
MVNSFPELMDLIARWAPAVQAATITHVMEQVWGLDLQDYGLVETVAARAAYGSNQVLARMQRDK